MANVAVIGEGWRIPLTKGRYTIVDEMDFKLYGHLKWHLSAKGYAVRRPREGSVFLHRLINGTPTGFQTDHMNHNKLDNRRKNLRTVTNQQNHFNRPLDSNNTSGHKGVSWNKEKRRWQAHVTRDDRKMHLGYYSKLEHAVEARKKGEGVYHV